MTQQQTITPAHRHLFRVLLDEVGENFDHSKPNIEAVAEAMGWSEHQVISGLQALRRAGVLKHTKQQLGRRRWSVVWSAKRVA